MRESQRRIKADGDARWSNQKNKQEWKKVKTLKKHKKLVSGMLAVPDQSGGVQVWSCDIAGTILTWNTKVRAPTRGAPLRHERADLMF
jgi:hypothetical protein